MSINGAIFAGPGEYVPQEGVAAGAILPGHVIEWAAGELQVVGTLGNVSRLVALPASYEGNGVDDAYAADDQVVYVACKSGDRVRLRAAEQSIAISAALETKGDGTVGAVTTGEALFVALEAEDNTGGSGSGFVLAQVI